VNLFEQIPKPQDSPLQGRQTPTGERIRNFFCRSRHWKVGAGEAQENRKRGGDRVGDKSSLEAEHVGEPAAEKRTHGRTDVIRTVQTAYDPAALMALREIDAGNFSSSCPKAIRRAHNQSKCKDRDKPRHPCSSQCRNARHHRTTHQSDTSSHAIQYDSSDHCPDKFADGECRHDLRCAAGRNTEFPRQNWDRRNDDRPGAGKKGPGV
jgi:hypothetical protein